MEKEKDSLTKKSLSPSQPHYDLKLWKQNISKDKYCRKFVCVIEGEWHSVEVEQNDRC